MNEYLTRSTPSSRLGAGHRAAAAGLCGAVKALLFLLVLATAALFLLSSLGLHNGPEDRPRHLKKNFFFFSPVGQPFSSELLRPPRARARRRRRCNPSPKVAAAAAAAPLQVSPRRNGWGPAQIAMAGKGLVALLLLAASQKSMAWRLEKNAAAPTRRQRQRLLASLRPARPPPPPHASQGDRVALSKAAAAAATGSGT